LFEKYLGNLFTPDGAIQLFTITLLAFFSAVPLITESELAFSYGRLRFGVDSPHDWQVRSNGVLTMLAPHRDMLIGRGRTVGALRMLRFIFGIVISAPIAITAAFGVENLSGAAAAWVLLAAYVAAACILRFLLFLRNLCVRSKPVIYMNYFGLDLPLQVLMQLLGLPINRIERHWMRVKNKTAPRPATRDPHPLAGYRPIPSANRKWWHWYSGHLSGFVLLLAYFALYLIVVLWLSPWDDHGDWFPPLGYVLLLLGLVNWALPILAFFFDRWRLPVPIVLMALWALCTLALSDESHYYWVTTLKNDPRLVTEPTAPDPAGVRRSLTTQRALSAWLAHRKESDSNVIVIVTAAGGGIVASAWTADALIALDEAFGESFTSRLWAISSVSGGSVGTLYYMLEFPRSAANLQSSERVRQAARSSSLAASAWGVVGPDFWRFAAKPLGLKEDRATALEEAWKNAWRRQFPTEMKAQEWPTLHGWRKRVRSGELPIVFFNATSVETGAAYVFTPIDVHGIRPLVKPNKLPTENQSAGRPAPRPFAGFGNFVEDYPGYDVECVTAARLSATFPWVTPVARAALRDDRAPVSPHLHLADGGYFDNFGLVTVVELLHATLPTLKNGNIQTIVLIDISPWSRGAAAAAIARDRRLESLSLQAVGPLSTLYGARSTSQAGRAASEIRLLHEALKQHQIKLEHVPVFMDEYVEQNNFDVPLSWHLDQQERGVLAAARRGLRHALGLKIEPRDPSAADSSEPITRPILQAQWNRVRELFAAKDSPK
jgi:hypothetical protein